MASPDYKQVASILKLVIEIREEMAEIKESMARIEADLEALKGTPVHQSPNTHLAISSVKGSRA